MKRSLLKRAAVALVCCSIAAAASARSATDVRWVGAWGAAPDSEGPSLRARTVRQIVRIGIGGSRVRLRLSNLFGTGPVTIGPVRVAVHVGGSSTRPGTDRAVTFGGRPTVTIAKGADALSDPVLLPVTALQQLAVSMYLPGSAGPSTIHGSAVQTAFIAPGDATAATTFPAGETDTSRYFLTDVEVAAAAGARTLVIVGDSITDGIGSTDDANARWPDALADRLQADSMHSSIAVVNSGIAGNRLLKDGPAPFVGPSLLSRFDRDALGKPGVRWVLVFSGINDISAARILETPKDQVSAEQVVDGLKRLIARARQKGVGIWGATLMPTAGSEFSFPAGEEIRQRVNTWIRTSGAFDAVVDFDRAVRDPERPDRLLPAFDSGDHLHPNDAGYRAMAAAIDLRALSR